MNVEWGMMRNDKWWGIMNNEWWLRDKWLLIVGNIFCLHYFKMIIVNFDSTNDPLYLLTLPSMMEPYWPMMSILIPKYGNQSLQKIANHLNINLLAKEKLTAKATDSDRNKRTPPKASCLWQHHHWLVYLLVLQK